MRAALLLACIALAVFPATHARTMGAFPGSDLAQPGGKVEPAMPPPTAVAPPPDKAVDAKAGNLRAGLDVGGHRMLASGTPSPLRSAAVSPPPSAAISPSATRTPASATSSVSISLSSTSSRSITAAVTSSRSITASVTSTISATASVTPSRSITASRSVSPSASVTRTISVTPSVTRTISVTPSQTPTVSHTSSVTPTISRTPTISVTTSRTSSVSPSRSVTSSISVTVSKSRTTSPTISGTASATISRTRTRTHSATPPHSKSPSTTTTATHTRTSSPSLSRSVSTSPSASRTRSVSVSRSRTPSPASATPSASVTPPPTPSPVSFSYFGGPIIQSINNIPIFWNSTVRYQKELEQFYYAIVANNAWFDILREYSVPGYTIMDGASASPVDVSASLDSGVILTDTDLQLLIIQWINNESLPYPQNDTLFSIHFPATVTITKASGVAVKTSCIDFCGYHSNFVWRSQRVYYSVVPECDCSYPGMTFLDNIQATVSHEIAEAITDPFIGRGKAWYLVGYGEIADVCQGYDQWGNVTLGDGNSYVVQELWSNRFGSCILNVPLSLK